MPRPLNIQMPDGTWFRIDQDEWKVLTCQVHTKPRGNERLATDQLFIRRHEDGRVLVYVVLAPASGELATVTGEVVAGADAKAAIWRIVKRFSLPESIADECLAALQS
jgi:hypothetical protein